MSREPSRGSLVEIEPTAIQRREIGDDRKAESGARRRLVESHAACDRELTIPRSNYSNGAEIVRTIRDDFKIEGVDPGLARATGQVTSRFAETLLLDDARTNAAVELEHRISDMRRLTVTLHEASLSLAKTPIQGPAGVQAAFDLRAAYNAAAGRMMTVTLKNGVETYA